MAEPDEVPLKRKNSYGLLPPYMSELRVVLLGNSWRQRSSVGNLLLGETMFNTNTEEQSSVRISGTLQDKNISVTNTPDLLQPDLNEHRLTEFIKEISEACAPGPHVFLLVLQPEDFTETHKTRLQSVLEMFSEQAFDHSLVIISPPREETPGYMEQYMKDPHLQDMIIRCRYRYLNQKNLELTELLTRVGQIIKENNREHMSEHSEEEDTGLTLTIRRNAKPSLNMVLCGRHGEEKISVVRSMLGVTALPSAPSPEQCVKHQGQVCGRWVSVVEMPALSGKPLETVMHQCLSCVSLCGPEGVHAFILVLPVGSLTDEDKAEIKTIQDTFSSRVNDFTLVLFTVESDSAAVSAVNFPKETRVDIEELCQICRGESLYLNISDRQQVLEMLEEVEKMTQERARSFTKDMFTEAQMERVLDQHKELKPPETSMSPMGLRLVLIGKSGVGKNATANTILGKKQFKPRAAPKKASSSCEKACATVEGLHVAVVNTPPLLDKSFNDEPLHQELSKCITMLSPGPHAFLLLLQIGNISPEEKRSLEVVKKVFGQKAVDFVMIVFTRGDELEGQSLESYVDNCDSFVKDLLNQCRGRYHVVNNKHERNHTQVSQLLHKINKMVHDNSSFTKEMYEIERKAEVLTTQHKREVKMLKGQISECNKRFDQERALRDRQLKEKEESLNQERQERRKEQEEEVKRRKRQDQATHQDWKRKLEDAERRIEAEEKQKAVRLLQQVNRDMVRKQEEWEKERKDILESRIQELKLTQEVQSERYSQLQEEYHRKQKKWISILFVALLVSLFLGYYSLLNYR